METVTLILLFRITRCFHSMSVSDGGLDRLHSNYQSARRLFLATEGGLGVGDGGRKVCSFISSWTATEVAAAVHRTASESASQAVDSVLKPSNDSHLLLGAIGLAVGAGIAAALPGTDSENRLMATRARL
jgi:hypothetical protein